jgi:hypothetical protein
MNSIPAKICKLWISNIEKVLGLQKRETPDHGPYVPQRTKGN